MSAVWTSHPEAAALIAAVLAERPVPAWLRERGMFLRCYPRYISKDAGALRKLHDRLCEEALAADADHDTFADLYRNEPDDVLHRLLQEQDDAEALTVCRPDPFRHVEGEAA